MEKNKIATVNVYDGKMVLELQLPGLFLATPITEAGLETLMEELSKEYLRLKAEEETLENVN